MGSTTGSGSSSYQQKNKSKSNATAAVKAKNNKGGAGGSTDTTDTTTTTDSADAIVQEGQRIEIWWPEDECYYRGIITQVRLQKGKRARGKGQKEQSISLLD